MRTLRQIDNDILAASQKRAKELEHTPTGDLMSQNEIIAIQANLRFGDKYREMYHLLEEIEKYFAPDPTGEVPQSPEAQSFLNRIQSI